MEPFADSIVRSAVEAEKNNRLGGSVDQFVRRVEDRIRDTTDNLRDAFGESAREVIGAALEGARSYRESKEQLFDPAFHVDAIQQSHGAAGMAEVTSSVITIDVAGMVLPESPGFDAGYWGRVAEHERIHQLRQAGHYDLQQIVSMDGRGEVFTTDVHALAEWQPSSQANLPGDLTAEYRRHVSDGERLIASIGTDGQTRLEQALKTGNMRVLQEEILARKAAQFGLAA